MYQASWIFYISFCRMCPGGLEVTLHSHSEGDDCDSQSDLCADFSAHRLKNLPIIDTNLGV
jgi:hypothetical protein